MTDVSIKEVTLDGDPSCKKILLMIMLTLILRASDHELREICDDIRANPYG